MEESKELIDHIKSCESLRLEAYLCPAKIPTIGWGHTSGVKLGQKITLAQAESLLRGDILPCRNYVNSLHLDLTQGQFDALVDFVFNLGAGKLRDSTLLRYIKAKQPATEIQKQFMKWVYSGGKKLNGLVKRREWEAKRWVS